MSVEEALEEIKKGSGTQFDPVVVKAFEDCFDKITGILKHDNIEIAYD